MPWAALPEAVGGLPAAEICAGHPLYGATPRAVLSAAAAASLGGEGGGLRNAGSQVPPWTSEGVWHLCF